jgi:hypothetical protein
MEAADENAGKKVRERAIKRRRERKVGGESVHTGESERTGERKGEKAREGMLSMSICSSPGCACGMRYVSYAMYALTTNLALSHAHCIIHAGGGVILWAGIGTSCK